MKPNENDRKLAEKIVDVVWKTSSGKLNDAREIVAQDRADQREGQPKIVCLCGSTRFMDAFFETGWDETLAGNIVLSVGVCKHVDAGGGHGGEMLGQDVADKLDELHLRKIDLADEVIVLRVNGYVGPSTSKEIKYAESQSKPIRYVDYGEDHNE